MLFLCTQRYAAPGALSASDRSCQVQDLIHIFSRSVWKSLAWSQRRKLGVHWELSWPWRGSWGCAAAGTCPCHRETRVVMAGKGWWGQGGSGEHPGAWGSHTFTGITCETVLFPAWFSSCVMVPGARHPLPEVGGEVGCKNTDTGQMWHLPKFSVTRKGEKEQPWNGDVSPWHGTHVLAPRTRRHLVTPCTAWLQQSASSVSPETHSRNVWSLNQKAFPALYEFSFTWWWYPSWLPELLCGSRTALQSHSQNFWVHRNEEVAGK